MTLSPVFRSTTAVHLLREEGVWERLAHDIVGQARAVERLRDELPSLIDSRFTVQEDPLPGPEDVDDPRGLEFLQEFFFLILFRSIFRTLGVSEERLSLYAELDFCIKGTITAADNLFDDQSKSLLPLRSGRGSRYLSILQLMCFERLLRSALDRARLAGVVEQSAQISAIQKGLMTRMAEIGELEGSEEGGVEDIPSPARMIQRVHRVRGGALFALAFVAPRILEDGDVAARLSRAEAAVARLGTAFQIVDDLTDFEFDVGRRSHNLLVSQVRHHGTDAERETLKELWEGRSPVREGEVEASFEESARTVLQGAYEEARASFESLEELGFWFPPRLADEVVRAIVGLEGVARMESLTAGG
ncbi:MAG: class 1 isoprenoid biosynthesis enzyme [Longimicrobiales bacterium]